MATGGSPTYEEMGQSADAELARMIYFGGTVLGGPAPGPDFYAEWERLERSGKERKGNGVFIYSGQGENDDA